MNCLGDDTSVVESHLSIGRLGVRSTATEWIAAALHDKSVHLNRPNRKHISGFGLPPIAVTKNKKWIVAFV